MKVLGLKVFGAAVLLGANGLAQTTERASVNSTGGPGNGESRYSAISGDGRYVAFGSVATNLVPGEANPVIRQVYVHDRQTAATERVSVDSSGNQGNGVCYDPAISGDGRYVALESLSSNLVPGDTNGTADVFVHDRQTGATERVSVDSSGDQGNGYSGTPDISGDGRYVAFTSSADNLVPGDTNGVADAFVHDRQTGTTERASVDSSGNQGSGNSSVSAISGDGRCVAFESFSSNLVPGDTNGVADVFVHDRQTGTTERASVDSSGNQGNGYCFGPTISGDGRYVAFYSAASNLVPGDTNGSDDIFVRDRQTGTTERASVDSSGSQANGSSWAPSISGNGRCVAFASFADNLVPSETNPSNQQLYVHDRQTGSTERASVDSFGKSGNDHSFLPAISGDGRCVAFESYASNLVPGDTNGAADIFVRDRGCGSGSPLNYCTAGTSASGCQALLSTAGTPSATATSGFTVTATGVEGVKDGLFFYGTNGSQANPWGNGASYQCVIPPTIRTPTLNSSGTVGSCNGSMSRDMNAYWFANPIKNPGLGATVDLQLWYRDPLNTSSQTTSLSDAIEFEICE